MFASKLRVAAIAVGATLSLSACVGPYGDVGMGYGSGGYYGGYGSGGYYGGYGSYGSPYGYSPYGYSSYGYSPYGYSPYGGWYDNYYYPGSGYYVYSRDGSRHRWTDSQQRYWQNRRTAGDRGSFANVVGREMTRNRDAQQVQQVQQAQPQRTQRIERVQRSDSSTSSDSSSGERRKSTWRRRGNSN